MDSIFTLLSVETFLKTLRIISAALENSRGERVKRFSIPKDITLCKQEEEIVLLYLMVQSTPSHLSYIYIRQFSLVLRQLPRPERKTDASHSSLSSATLLGDFSPFLFSTSKKVHQCGAFVFVLVSSRCLLSDISLKSFFFHFHT
ncbi:hypothetical protein E2C01_095768 [Portunus trituberculatus]|uniref:Uncharacterized protein n=1 Tax=Portunus trituberculatus TaxID=210409 RepID=A0A5B7K6K9_PORTR|nr:hypothetical protein [Portunus trituberculatus]